MSATNKEAQLIVEMPLNTEQLIQRMAVSVCLGPKCSHPIHEGRLGEPRKVKRP